MSSAWSCTTSRPEPEGHRGRPRRVAATVSRLLKRAMDDGLVRVELDLPAPRSWRPGSSQTYGLREAVVVASGGRGDLRAELGRRRPTTSKRFARTACASGCRAVHALPHDPLAARAPLPRPRALPVVRREHAQARRHLRQHARRHDGAKYRPHVRAMPCPSSTCSRSRRSSASAGACCATPRCARSTTPPGRGHRARRNRRDRRADAGVSARWPSPTA